MVFRRLEGLRELSLSGSFEGSPSFFTSLARARPELNELWFGQQSTLDDACIAALVENLSLETLSIDENHTLTSEAIEIILRSPTAQTLSYGQFYKVDAFTSANILRLVRGCPKLIDLLWHLDCDRHVDGQNVDDLLALLKDRGKGNPDQYVEVDVL